MARSESLDQLNLTSAEDEAIAEAAEEQAKPETPTAEAKTPRQHSRKLLPDHPIKCCPRVTTARNVAAN